MKKILTLLFTTISLTVIAQTNIVYDVVLMGGRVIDPETKSVEALTNVDANRESPIDPVVIVACLLSNAVCKPFV